jgi:hypothetical protein
MALPKAQTALFDVRARARTFFARKGVSRVNSTDRHSTTQFALKNATGRRAPLQPPPGSCEAPRWL